MTSGFSPAQPNQNVEVNAIQIRFGVISQVLESEWVRVRVYGDFIRGRHHVSGEFFGVDADHLPKWLPGRKSGDGIEGGTFASWFRPRGQG